MTVKTLLLDIETAPAKVYSWGLYDQNIGINQIVEDGYVLCWCAKWLGSKEIMSDSLASHKDHFTKNPRCDKKIAETIWNLLNEADVVVTHNGNSFDLTWLNTTFIKHGLGPVSPYKSVDTFVSVKKRFRFISNKLDFICRKLDLGHKINTGGFELWDECMRGVQSSWDKMVKYCKHDVRLLERLYLSIRPFVPNHPNVALYSDDCKCPVCGKNSLISRGHAYTISGKYQRYQCKSCGKWSRGKKLLGKTSVEGV